MPVPPLTPAQRAAALQRAVAARHRRATVKADVAAGRLSLAEVLDLAREEDAVGRIRVATLLECFNGIGPVRAGHIMEEVGIANSRRLRGLGVHQSRRLLQRWPGVVR